MTKTPNTKKKLAYAHYFLHELQALNQKIIGKDPLAFEALWTACVEQTAGAYNVLKSEVGEEALNCELNKLFRPKQRLLQSMTGVRGHGVHVKGPKFTVRKKEVRPELVPGVSVAVMGMPPTLIGASKGSWGATVTIQDYLHGTKTSKPEDAVDKCKRYLDIVESLAAKFQ